jgi:hypothetical protein
MDKHLLSIDEIRINNLAYAYWQARGQPLGTPEVDWFAAEKTLGGPFEPQLPLLAEHWGPNEADWR